jgi:predicted MPP superfamily phosphohydrolase
MLKKCILGLILSKELKNMKYGKYSVLGNHDYGEYVDLAIRGS